MQGVHRRPRQAGAGRRRGRDLAAVRGHPRVHDDRRAACGRPEFSALLHAFYRIAAAAIADHEGVVDKFVGDEAIGLFIPGFAGRDHAAKAIGAGRALLAAVSRRDASASGPIPVGAGIHTGVAYVGSVGASGEISDFTALGDVVNSTARLASLAAAGELLVSTDAASHARLTADGLERRAVDVRGREEGLEVLVIRPAG